MQLIDTHTHLFSEQFSENATTIQAVLQRATEAGVSHCFLPNVDSSTLDAMNRLADEFPQICLPMIGLHPCSVKENWKEELALIENELKTGVRRYWGIGETGIDLYWDTTFFAQQQIALHQQAEWAKTYHLPLILHTRSAFNETFSLIKEHADSHLSGIFHCFVDDVAAAEQILSLGNFYLGIGGVLTFKNSGLAETLIHLPLEAMVLETDSPYLAPVPYRGKRNESAYIRLVAEKLAQIKGVSVEEVAHITTQNARKLFGL